MKYLLLTGTTGLIGRYLLRDLLLANIPVVALVRPSKRADGRQRVEEVVTTWESILNRSLPRPEVLIGDIHESGLKIDRRDRAWLAAHCDVVVHNAGNVAFHQSGNDGEPWRTNVEGTRNLVELADEAAIDEFHYMSTAYVCGNRPGTILEADVECGQRFDSNYEHSKLTAELILRGAGFRKLNVLRPPAVIGDSVTGYTSTYHGVYSFAQFTWISQQRAGAAPGTPWSHPVRLFQTGAEKHHFVPVDVLVNACRTIIAQRDQSGATYHLTPIQACTMAELESALSVYFGYEGVRFVEPDLIHTAELNEIERLFYESVAGGEHRYFIGDPSFDCGNTLRAVPNWENVRVTQDMLIRMFDFAVQQRFRKNRVPMCPSPGSEVQPLPQTQ